MRKGKLGIRLPLYWAKYERHIFFMLPFAIWVAKFQQDGRMKAKENPLSPLLSLLSNFFRRWLFTIFDRFYDI